MSLSNIRQVNGLTKNQRTIMFSPSAKLNQALGRQFNQKEEVRNQTLKQKYENKILHLDEQAQQIISKREQSASLIQQQNIEKLAKNDNKSKLDPELEIEKLKNHMLRNLLKELNLELDGYLKIKELHSVQKQKKLESDTIEKRTSVISQEQENNNLIIKRLTIEVEKQKNRVELLQKDGGKYKTYIYNNIQKTKQEIIEIKKSIDDKKKKNILQGKKIIDVERSINITQSLRNLEDQTKELETKNNNIQKQIQMNQDAINQLRLSDQDKIDKIIIKKLQKSNYANIQDDNDENLKKKIDSLTLQIQFAQKKTQTLEEQLKSSQKLITQEIDKRKQYIQNIDSQIGYHDIEIIKLNQNLDKVYDLAAIQGVQIKKIMSTQQNNQNNTDITQNTFFEIINQQNIGVTQNTQEEKLEIEVKEQERKFSTQNEESINQTQSLDEESNKEQKQIQDEKNQGLKNNQEQQNFHKLKEIKQNKNSQLSFNQVSVQTQSVDEENENNHNEIQYNQSRSQLRFHKEKQEKLSIQLNASSELQQRSLKGQENLEVNSQSSQEQKNDESIQIQKQQQDFQVKEKKKLNEQLDNQENSTQKNFDIFEKQQQTETKQKSFETLQIQDIKQKNLTDEQDIIQHQAIQKKQSEETPKLQDGYNQLNNLNKKSDDTSKKTQINFDPIITQNMSDTSNFQLSKKNEQDDLNINQEQKNNGGIKLQDQKQQEENLKLWDQNYTETPSNIQKKKKLKKAQILTQNPQKKQSDLVQEKEVNTDKLDDEFDFLDDGQNQKNQNKQYQSKVDYEASIQQQKYKKEFYTEPENNQDEFDFIEEENFEENDDQSRQKNEQQENTKKQKFEKSKTNAKNEYNDNKDNSFDLEELL